MSLHQTIIAAVKTTIEGLTGEPTVKIRTDQLVIDGDTLPLIVLTKGAERTTGGGIGFDLREYEVFCDIHYAQNRTIESGMDDAGDWRETIRQHLVNDNTVAPGEILKDGLTAVTEVHNVLAVDFPAHEARILAANYEVSRLGLVYQTCEATHA